MYDRCPLRNITSSVKLRFKMMMSNLWVVHSWAKKNHRIIESCNNFWIIYAIRLPLSQLSDYITKMLFGLNLHVIQESPSVIYPWEKAMYLPSPHGQTFLPIFEKHIQAPTNTPTHPRTNSAFSYFHPYICTPALHWSTYTNRSC